MHKDGESCSQTGYLPEKLQPRQEAFQSKAISGSQSSLPEILWNQERCGVSETLSIYIVKQITDDSWSHTKPPPPSINTLPTNLLKIHSNQNNVKICVNINHPIIIIVNMAASNCCCRECRRQKIYCKHVAMKNVSKHPPHTGECEERKRFSGLSDRYLQKISLLFSTLHPAFAQLSWTYHWLPHLSDLSEACSD